MKHKSIFKRYKGLLLKGFDRDFYKSKGRQFLWLIGFFLLCLLVCNLFGLAGGVGPWRVVELLLDPGCFAGSDEEKCSVWIQLLITIIGSICFTSFLINAFGNWLDRRIELFKRGQVVYEFDNHILILGANSMLLNILRSLVAVPNNADRDIVIQTNGDVDELRAYIASEIPEKQAKNIYVVYGRRSHYDSLVKLDVFETKSIYILGEDNESIHDATNLECLRLLRTICERSKRSITCYMVLERLASVQHFYYKSDSGSTDKLHLIVINALENVAQRVLVSRYYESGRKYPAIDRGGISAECNIGVHLVVVGMSQMAYALATTAAHICHFPNFRSKGVRTKITFINENIRQEMDFFVGHYQSLMDLSYRKYINIANPENNKEYFPDPQYLSDLDDKKGFLDLEWEFIDGGIECDGVRDYLTDCSVKDAETEYLTIAFCESNAETNAAASLYLPLIIYDKKIPVFVYQPGGGEVLRSAKQTDRYANIFPFGMKTDCFDMQYQNRLIGARRIAYLYELANDKKDFVAMPSVEQLKYLWFHTQYAFQQSNLYAANSIPTKLRSVVVEGNTLTEKQIDTLSEVEHNRWNVERLLVGFRAYTYKERIAVKNIMESSDEDAIKECRQNIDKRKKNQFFHKDIAPYVELLDSSKEYDRAIVRNILEVIK